MNLISTYCWESNGDTHGVDNDLFNPWQFGGIPGRDVIAPIFFEELQWEIRLSFGQHAYLRYL